MNRTMLKAQSKRLMRSSNPNPIVAALFYVLVVYILNNLSTRLTGVQIDMESYLNAAQNFDSAYFQNIIKDYNPSGTAVILDIIIHLLLFILQGGFIIFALNTIRKSEEASYYNLLDGFTHALRIIVLNILMIILISLQTLLFIIPGIIAFYKYRMAIYLLLDDPKKPIMNCILDSKDMMKGHKSELFSLDLSFIGWFILELIPFVSIYVKPYTALTYAGYYDSLMATKNTEIYEDNNSI